MRSAGMRTSGIIDEIAAVECEPSHTRTLTRGITPASAPTTRRAAAAIYARNPINYDFLL
jgi:hypothetical protein